MRTTTRLWLTLACVLVAALAAVGKAGAAASHKRSGAHKHARRAAHVLGPQFSRRVRAAAVARNMIGVPYSWGGASPSGFDCSGLVMYAFGRVGVSLPHSSYALNGLGRHVGRWAMKPGDLVFFHGAGHVGIYLGKGRFIHAPRTGDYVKISSLRDSWYAATFDGGRRL